MQPWQARLQRGDLDGAWQAFEQDHRRLLTTVIRRLVAEPTLAEEALAVVTARLAEDGLRRLRRYAEDDPSGAAVSTWLVVVVRRLVIDFLRQEHGRQRTEIPADLEGWQRALYIARCLERLTVPESYERLRTTREGPLAFPAFLREVRALARTHPCPDARPRRAVPLSAVSEAPTVAVTDPAEAVEQSRHLARLLAAEPPDLQLAIHLFVVEERPAIEVARLVGWPNAKAVYNRVGRALARMRATLHREGLGADDL